VSLVRVVEESRSRGQETLDRERRRVEDERAQLLAERERRVTSIREEAERGARAEATRERAQRVAAAKMQARKFEYEAREKSLERGMDRVRELLRDYTRSPQYPDTLRRMLAYAMRELGPDVRVYGRAPDAPILRSVAAGRFVETHPLPALGGIVVETPNGNRRLNLTFDELLRLREDRVRERLSG
jgi:V/A-type H+-transporting ATPase subunit E